MKIRTLIKILLLITGGLSVLSVVLQNETIEIFAKPMTVPLFFMLYWFNTKKVDFLFVLVLLLCFLGDIFLLMQFSNSFTYILICYILCYFILFYYLYIDCKSISFSRSDGLYLVLFFIVWTAIVYVIYDIIYSNAQELQLHVTVYVLVLYFLLSGAVLKYINDRSSRSLWMAIAVLNFVISDSCFAFDRFYVSSLELKFINAIYQLLAVYFLVRFKLAKTESLKLIDN